MLKKLKKSFVFDPLSTILSTPDIKLKKILEDNKERNQVVSWHQIAIAKAWNLYHTIKIVPSEELIIKIITQALQEVTAVVKNNENGMSRKSQKILRFRNYLRPIIT